MTDPFILFEAWFAEARKTEVNDSNAMALATADCAVEAALHPPAASRCLRRELRLSG